MLAIRSLLPAAALLALLAPAPAADAAGGAEHPYPLATCIVCERPLKDDGGKVVKLEGREMRCCGDACVVKLRERSDYYEGVFDGAERSRNEHIGPKGGDTRKGAQ